MHTAFDISDFYLHNIGSFTVNRIDFDFGRFVILMNIQANYEITIIKLKILYCVSIPFEYVCRHPDAYTHTFRGLSSQILSIFTKKIRLFERADNVSNSTNGLFMKSYCFVLKWMTVYTTGKRANTAFRLLL